MNKLIFLLFVCFSFFCKAQQNNYWSIQYGGRSALLGGAAIGGFEDNANASFYYNPGAVGFLSNASLSINTASVGWYGYTYKNATGEGTKLADVSSFSVPYLISGIVPIKIAQTPKLKLGFTLFNKGVSESEFDYKQDLSTDFVDRYIGEETYNAWFNAYDKYQDQWFGITTAYPINDDFSVGLTTFLTFTERVASYNQNLIAYPSDEQLEIPGSTALRNVTNNRMRIYKNNLIFKLGASYKLNGSRIGFTFTAPSVGLNVFNYSSIEQMNDINNVAFEYDNGTSYINSLTLNGYADDIKSKYRRPMSIGLGYHFKYDNESHFSVSLEYFDGINTYNVLEVDNPSYPLTNQSSFTGFEPNRVVLRRANQAILNVAVGAEKRVSSRMSLLGSFRTNFSNYKEPDYSDVLPYEIFRTIEIEQDLYHVTFGIMGFVQKVNLDLNLGLDYAYGISRKEEPIANFQEPLEADISQGLFLQGETNFEATFISQQITILFGFQFGF